MNVGIIPGSKDVADEAWFTIDFTDDLEANDAGEIVSFEATANRDVEIVAQAIDSTFGKARVKLTGGTVGRAEIDITIETSSGETLHRSVYLDIKD